MTNPIVLRERLADPTTRIAAAIEIGDWARNLCLLMGTEFGTACQVGAVFATGIERSWRQAAGGSPQGAEGKP